MLNHYLQQIVAANPPVRAGVIPHHGPLVSKKMRKP